MKTRQWVRSERGAVWHEVRPLGLYGGVAQVYCERRIDGYVYWYRERYPPVKLRCKQCVAA